MKYLKKEYPSYNLHLIQSNKFKSTYIEVIFSEDFNKENITYNNFLSSIMTYSTKKHNTRPKYSKKMEDLYASSICASCYRLGKVLNVDFNMRVLNDKYSEKGLFEDAVDFLHEVIFSPNVSNDAFDKEGFKVINNHIKSQIERLKENQRNYAQLKLLELFDSNSPFSYNIRGDLDTLNKITPNNLYDYYKKFIKCNVIDIYVIGDIDFDYTEKVIVNKFKFDNKLKEFPNPIIEYKNHRKKIMEVIESDNTNQSKLAIACTIENMTKYEKDYVLNLYNIILGGSADSKFFKNIREKYSMCYYVSSSANKLDNILLISSGINKENYSKMMILINKEMSDMKKGEFSDEEIEKAKKYYISSLEEIEDNPNQIIASYYAMDRLNVDDIETRKKKMRKVTKEEIISLANKVYIDTVYLLGGDKK